MTFDIDDFRSKRVALQRTEVQLDMPPGPIEYSIEPRSSFKTWTTIKTRMRHEVSEHFVTLSDELKQIADENGGHQAIQILARHVESNADPDMISFYKYSPLRESWVHLHGIDLAPEPTNEREINENLRKFEADFITLAETALPKAESPSANTRSGAKGTDPIEDPEVDDDPTPVGQRKREPFREAFPPKKKSKAKDDAPDDEDDDASDDEDDPQDRQKPPAKPGKGEPADDGTAGNAEPSDDDGAASKSPPAKAGAQTMGPKSPGPTLAPPPKGKELKMPKKRGVMGMDPDKDGFAKHHQRMTLPTTVMGASKQIQLWRSKWLV